MLLQATVLVITLSAVALCIFLQSPRNPKNIPSVPFWVSLLPLIYDVDQQDLFNKYIREPLLQHGAVKLFFGSQWNIIIQSPAILAQVFKNEDLYQKSGNQKKIPGSVLASFLGDNIISAHGEDHKLYREIMKPGLQSGWTTDAIYGNAELLLQEFTRDPGVPMAVQENLQRYTIANVAQAMFGVQDIDMQHEEVMRISGLQSRVKGQIFRPTFMSFPFLDKLGLRTREKARRDASVFTDQLVDMVLQNRSKDPIETQDQNTVGTRLANAWTQDLITTQQLRDNITVLFVDGQENPQLALLSILYLLAKNPHIQDQLHAEVIASPSPQPTEESRRSMVLLTTTIYESLRLLPPINQLINRLATVSLILSPDNIVPAGTYIGYNSHATNTDTRIWGRDAEEFVPRRWGESVEDVAKQYRRRKARAEFITFHGGSRACLGERFAMAQLKLTLYVIVRELKWKLDPGWEDRMTAAGPLAPRGLRLIFEKRS